MEENSVYLLILWNRQVRHSRGYLKVGMLHAESCPCPTVKAISFGYLSYELILKESTGMAPFHQWKLSMQLWHAKQFALKNKMIRLIPQSRKIQQKNIYTHIYQCGLTFAHTHNPWGSSSSQNLNIGVPTKIPHFFWRYDVWSANYKHQHCFLR